MSDLHLLRAPVENPRGTVVLVHGLGEHSGRYGHIVELLNSLGFSVLAYDQRGHGRSPGRKGVLPKMATLLEDLAAVIDQVEVRPLVLFGHSMGGLVAARFVAEGLTEHGEPPAAWHRKVDYLVLSSPAFANKLKTSDRIKLALTRFITPNLAFPNGIDPEKISHDPEVVRAYRQDPLNHDRVTPRLVDFILGSGKLVRRRASKWSTSTLLLFAGADEIVDPKGSRAFVFAAPRYVVKAHELPGTYHEIFNEREPAKGEALTLLREWLETTGKMTAVQIRPMLQRLALAVLLVVPVLAEARERAVLIYPKERSWFRRIFYTSHQQELRSRIAAAYDVDVHEQVSDEREIFDVDIDGAQLLVLSAHGDPYSMYFGSRKARTLDSTDRARLAQFFDRLDPFATIVLQSCHTGRGFAHVVKEAAGPARRVIAARGEVPWDGLRVTSVTPFDVIIDCDDGGRRWDCTVRLR